MKKKNGAMICGFRTSKNRMNGKNRIIIIDGARCYSMSSGNCFFASSEIPSGA